MSRTIDTSETPKEGIDDMMTGFYEHKQVKTEQQKVKIADLKVRIWNNMNIIYERQKKVER